MIKSVLGTNAVEVMASVEGDRCVSVAALDNLVKGAAGQAVQIFDQIFGFPNTGHLIVQGVWP
jgi:N-acetyl-gamma-glutamyl-phosphate reductase